MSCIVYQTDKKTGVKYAYESISYWDKEKKQPRSTRKYLGRVDEETGEIIYKDEKPKRGADKDAAEASRISELKGEIEKRDRIIKELKDEIKSKDAEYRKLAAAVGKAVDILDSSITAE